MKKQLTCNISAKYMRQLDEIVAHYKDAFPLTKVTKYEVVEAIIEDHHAAIKGLDKE